MKNLILPIAMALLTFTNSSAGNPGRRTADAMAKSTVNDTAIAKPDPICTDEKTIAEVIAQDNKIIESSNETLAPLLPGKSMEEIIAGDKLVIEGAPREISPLDFNKINRKKPAAPIKRHHRERLIGSL